MRCARKESAKPLYVLVWGGLDDLAQALHDAPDIAPKIRVYWIGGPNKKWSINSYVYIVENFPDLWFIENNVAYRAFIADGKKDDKYNKGFYDYFAKGAGALGADFGSYLGGRPKMGDTPALLYMMDGDPADPTRESWGGSFESCDRSPRVVFRRAATAADTVQNYAIIEFLVAGPELPDSMVGRPCVTLNIAWQSWPGYYMGGGDYMARYSTYTLGTLPYTIVSDVDGFPAQSGAVTIANSWPAGVGPPTIVWAAIGGQTRARPSCFTLYYREGQQYINGAPR